MSQVMPSFQPDERTVPQETSQTIFLNVEHQRAAAAMALVQAKQAAAGNINSGAGSPVETAD